MISSMYMSTYIVREFERKVKRDDLALEVVKPSSYNLPLKRENHARGTCLRP